MPAQGIIDRKELRHEGSSASGVLAFSAERAWSDVHHPLREVWLAIQHALCIGEALQDVQRERSGRV